MTTGYTYQAPVNYTVDVSLSSLPSGLADYETNTIAIFSNEPASFSENYIRVIQPSTAEAAFGSNSRTYKMVNALFSPTTNFRTGGGELYIFKFDGTNATAGTLTTASLASSLDNFKLVDKGVLTLTIDGTDTEIKGLNFTSVNTLEDVVTVIKSQNPDVDITVESNAIVFTSRRFGTAIAIKASTVGTGETDISGADYLNANTCTAVSGTNADAVLGAAVTAALQQAFFGCVLTTQDIDNDAIIANATALQSKDLTYIEVTKSHKNIAVLGALLKSAGLKKTRVLSYSLSATKEAAATYASIAASVNHKGSDTANTLNLKTLTGILADTNLSDTYVLDARDNGIDIYPSTGGISTVYSNDRNGYTDDIFAQIAIKKAMEVGGFNYLRQTNTKIPQTEKAMTGLKNAYLSVADTYRENGTIAAGTWNGSYPFGNAEDFARNIEESGVYIYSLPIVKQPQADREARKAPVCQMALKFSGACHFSQLIITVQR